MGNNNDIKLSPDEEKNVKKSENSEVSTGSADIPSDPKGQNELADSFYRSKEYEKAVEWYTKAAEQGYAAAQNRLGYSYEYGQGVIKDYSKAAEWYSKAANQGHAGAQNSLGLCYEHGKGVDKDYSKAVEWYSKAAYQGNADAQNNLGLCYEFGTGVAQNYSAAKKWYAKAAKWGSPLARYHLDDLESRIVPDIESENSTVIESNTGDYTPISDELVEDPFDSIFTIFNSRSKKEDTAKSTASNCNTSPTHKKGKNSTEETSTNDDPFDSIFKIFN